MIDKQESKQSPMVSVVMCTYNSEQYIAEAIDSILAQTFCDFEFIIWDDGSTDETKQIVERYNDERIRYSYHENTGLGMALKLACVEVKGKYIARMDSDDICLPYRFASEVEYLETHEDCVLVSSAVYNIDETGKVIGRTFPCNDDKVLKIILSKSVSMIVHPMVMMRRDAYEKAGGYLPIRKSQDVLFWSRLAKQGRFYNITTPLGKYRILSTSLDHTVNPYKKVLSEMLSKMVVDETVKDSDIDVYNRLYIYSKRFMYQEKKAKNLNVKTIEERLYNIIRPLIKQKLAEKLIIYAKNVYHRMKLKNYYR